MTAFFLYFETKNAAACDHRGFDQVGHFAVPAEIDTGLFPMVRGGRSLQADTSHHGLGEYFRTGPSGRARTLLFDFLRARLAIEAVQAHLKYFIYYKPIQLTLDDPPMDVNLDELDALFHHAFFDRRPLLSLPSPGAGATLPEDAT